MSFADTIYKLVLLPRQYGRVCRYYVHSKQAPKLHPGYLLRNNQWSNLRTQPCIHQLLATLSKNHKNTSFNFSLLFGYVLDVFIILFFIIYGRDIRVATQLWVYITVQNNLVIIELHNVKNVKIKLAGFITMSWEKSVTVNLNSDSTGCFYTGDIVTGTITLDIDKDQKIETINLEIVGISRAQWSRAMPTMPYIKIYSEKKKNLFIKITDIFGSYRRGNKIPAGVYSYPFHFALPGDLPSTFKSSIAKVHYCIKIKSKPKYVMRKVVPFKVLGNVNINNLDEMLTPRVYEFNRIFKRMPGKVAVYVRTYKGIASRQTIPFEVTLNNEKKIRISELNITLIQKLQYTVSSGHAIEEKKMSKITQDVGKAMSGFYVLKMEIPQVTPSSIHTFEPMIDISYAFRVEVCFPFHFNFYEDIPVTVATVPVIHYDF